MRRRTLDLRNPPEIERAYAMILQTTSMEEWREIRTDAYWEKRDKIKGLLQKKLFTVNWFNSYRRKQRPSYGKR